MRLITIGIMLLLTLGPTTGAADDDSASKTAYPEIAVDAELKRMLKEIHGAGAYGVPELVTTDDETYAGTSREFTPFGSVKPFKEHFLIPLNYLGPGRSIPEPEKLETVKLGFIGPIEATVSVATGGQSHEEVLGKQMLRGSQLAIEEANAHGGYAVRGIPFELVISNDNGLWGASGNEIINLAYLDKVWGILGTIDGANSHIAIRVALKAEIMMINTGDTDPTFVETNIPWIARNIGDDRQMGYLLADYLYRKLDFKRVGIIRASNRYGRFGVRELVDSSRRLGRPVIQEMAYPVGSDDFSLMLERLQKADVEAIVHWGDARESALILNQMRALGMTHAFFANDRSVSDEFVTLAGDHAEGVICTFPWKPDRKDDRLALFNANFIERFGVAPDMYAAHGYDGMNMMIWAVRTVGLNRAKIRDIFSYFRVRPYPGVTGDIKLSAVLDDVGEVYLARYEKGEWRYLSRQDLKIPAANTPSPEPPVETSANTR